MFSQVIELRKQLEERWPDAQPLRHATAVGVPTGVVALDAILPGGGLPRGRLRVWEAGRAVGSTAVLRSACTRLVEQGERAAWVDGAAVLGDVGSRGPLLLRPVGALEALVCAEELVRCGGFGLVVVTGVGRALTGEAVRLSRAAREGGSALVAVAAGEGVPVVGLRLSSRLLPEAVRWRNTPFGDPAEPALVRLCVEATSLGLESRAEFMIPVVQHALRVSMEPGLVDRRGAGRGARRGSGRGRAWAR